MLNVSDLVFQRLRDLAKQYKSEGVPVGGVGIQGHIRNIDVNTIKVCRVDYIKVNVYQSSS